MKTRRMDVRRCGAWAHASRTLLWSDAMRRCWCIALAGGAVPGSGGEEQALSCAPQPIPCCYLLWRVLSWVCHMRWPARRGVHALLKAGRLKGWRPVLGWCLNKSSNVQVAQCDDVALKQCLALAAWYAERCPAVHACTAACRVQAQQQAASTIHCSTDGSSGQGAAADVAAADPGSGSGLPMAAAP